MADTPEQKLNDLLNTYGINAGANQDAYNHIIGQFNAATDKEDFINKLTKHPAIIPSAYQFGEQIGAITNQLQDFSTWTGISSGIDNTIISQVNREIAADKNIAFADPYIATQFNDDQTCQTALNNQLRGQNGNILLTGAVSVYEDQSKEENKHLERFIKALQQSPQNYNKIMIPIGAHPQTGPGHNFSLVLEGNKATIIDQMGSNAYLPIKTSLTQTLNSLGFQTIESLPPKQRLYPNNNDCVIATSLINQYVMDDKLNELLGKDEATLQSESAAHFAQYKKYALDAVYRNYLNDPVFLLYLEAKGLSKDDFEQLPPDQKKIHLDAVKLPSAATIDNEPENTPADELWKDQMRRIFEKKCNDNNRKFQEIAGTKELSYQMGDSPTDKVTFYSPSSASVVSKDVTDYIITCQTFKENGHDSITFGPNILKHPELAAKLYLACLKTDMPMHNQPALDTLKDQPEYAVISQILAGRQKEQQKEALRKEMAASRQELKDAQQNADNDPAYQQALQDYRDTVNDYNNNQLIKDLKQAIADRDAGKGGQAEVDKAQQAVDAALKDKTSDLYKLNETKEKAKETVEQNPLHKDLQTAKDTYNQTMQKGIDFVLGDPNNPDYARRLDRIKKISSRDLKDRTSVLTQRQGESAQAFADRKKAIEDGRWVDTLIRKPNESDADYQARQQALQTKWQQNGIDPDARVKDKEINQQRRLTQKAIQNAVRSR